MFSPDCICVCSFSTTSPSPMRSWVTLMPVISENALASVLDSYSWVVMVSDTTLMSMPWNGSAALMNHSISAICSSLLSEEGWNSLSTHRSAASMSAWAVPALATMARAAAVVNRYLLMPNPPLAFCCRHAMRSEEHTSELQSLMRQPYPVFCLQKKKKKKKVQPKMITKVKYTHKYRTSKQNH